MLAAFHRQEVVGISGFSHRISEVLKRLADRLPGLPDPGSRIAGLFALARADADEEFVPCIRDRLLNDPAPAVRSAAADRLAEKFPKCGFAGRFGCPGVAVMAPTTALVPRRAWDGIHRTIHLSPELLLRPSNWIPWFGEIHEGHEVSEAEKAVVETLGFALATDADPGVRLASARALKTVVETVRREFLVAVVPDPSCAGFEEEEIDLFEEPSAASEAIRAAARQARSWDPSDEVRSASLALLEALEQRLSD